MPFVYPGCLLLIAISRFRWKILQVFKFYLVCFPALIDRETIISVKIHRILPWHCCVMDEYWG